MFLIHQNSVFMIRSGKAKLLLVCFLAIIYTGKTQELLNRENSTKFARYLHNTQQYNLAAIEYERILSFSPADAEITINLLKAYRLGNICKNSFKNIEVLGAKSLLVNEMVATEYLNLALTCNCCYEKTDFERAMFSLHSEKQVLYKLGYHLLNQEYDSLFRIKEINRELITRSYSSVFEPINRMEHFRRKSPGLALAMSSVLPGSGKAYAGYWGDAVMSFIFVSSNAWLSYRGFSKKGVESASGWIFGSMSFGFYLGNIWGSGRAAKTYNEIEYQKHYSEAKNSIYNHF
jgi:hypothetical protein